MSEKLKMDGADLECLDAKSYATADGFVEWEPDFVSWRTGHDPIITKVLSDKLRLAGCLTGRLTVEDGVTWAEGWKRKMIYPNREAPFRPLLTYADRDLTAGKPARGRS